MTDTALGSSAFCPGCTVKPEAPKARRAADAHAALRRVELSLPEIHCAACIAGVEGSLEHLPVVRAARVNLSRKRLRATIEDAPGAEEELIEYLNSMGYTCRPLDSAVLEREGQDRQSKELLARIAVAGFAAMNVMLLSVAVWSGAADATRDLLHWISALIALPTVVFAGQPFFRSAWSALRVRRLNMDVPISLALILASGLSLIEVMEHGEHAYFDAALSLTFFLLIGRYLDHRTRAAAKSAATELSALEVHKAKRVTGSGTETVPLDALRVGDELLVAAGERIPADGTITQGESEVDTALLTGETLPAAVRPGSLVHAGMLNTSGPLRVRVEHLGEDTLLAEVAELVSAAETARNKYTSLAERAARIYAPAVHLLAALTLIGWGLLSQDWRLATNIAVSVLIITCPCALGLAVPAVLAAVGGKMFRVGILLKDGVALERLAEVDTIVFDKTGTLTKGKPVLANAHELSDPVKRAAMALATGSSHPLSKAIIAELGESHDAGNLREVPGKGVCGMLDSVEIRMGREDWLGVISDQQGTATWVQLGQGDPVSLTFEDSIRQDAAQTIAQLREQGYRVMLLSGDAPMPVENLAAAVGITEFEARLSPADKIERIEALKAKGAKVLMVGDGLNDAPALAAAHVSISPASAVDASRMSADMIVLGDRLDRIPTAIALAKRSRRRIFENFSVAVIYNLISVPIAVAGLVTPLIAAFAMSSSSIIVSLNALRLGRKI